MKKAFTLIELLVVIAIIAILAAILFPVFAQAKGAAKTTACMSNLKNLATSSKLYASDYDDSTLPNATNGFKYTPAYVNVALPHQGTGDWPNPEPGTRLAQHWFYIDQPYVKNFDIMFDPEFSEGQFSKAADAPTCDGAGTFETYPPVTTLNPSKGGWFTHYTFCFPTRSPSIGKPLVGDYLNTCGLYYDCTNASASPTVGSIPQNPYYNFAGGGWADDPDGIIAGFGGSRKNAFQAGSGYAYQGLPDTVIANPAQSVTVGDGGSYAFADDAALHTTSIPPDGALHLVDYLGCEGTGRHKGVGSNAGFADGHAKFFPLNPELILAQDSAGLYYAKYFSYDK